MSRPQHVRSLRIGAAMIAATALASTLVAPPALAAGAVDAAEPAYATIEIPAGPELAYHWRTWDGTVDQGFAIGADTTAIALADGIYPAVDYVACLLRDPSRFSEYWDENLILLEEYEPEQWNTPGPRTILGAASLVEGVRYQVECRSGDEDWAGWRLQWEVTATSTAGSTVTLPTGDEFSRNPRDLFYYGTYSDRAIPVRSGDHVRVIATPGAWTPGTSAGLLLPGGRREEDQPGTARIYGTVSADGSVLEWVVPEDPERFHEYYTDVVFTTRANTRWYDGFRIVDEELVSTLTAAVNRSLTVSALRTRVTAQVAVPNVPNPAGKIVVSVDGRDVATAALGAASAGRASITLPRLSRGVHVIETRYTGAEGIAGSTAPATRVRVLF